VASKAISHALIDGALRRSEGWSEDMARSLESVVLPGRSAFGRDDAREAGNPLLKHHAAIRIKPGGMVACINRSRRRWPSSMPRWTISTKSRTGSRVVLELNLQDVETTASGRCASATWPLPMSACSG
jgi:hypothetical protein